MRPHDRFGAHACAGLLAVALTLASGAGMAQVTTAEQDRTLYLDFIELRSKGSVCSERLPGFAEKFNPLFTRWRARNERRLRMGETFMQGDSAAGEGVAEARIKSVSSATVEMLETFSEPALREKCEPLMIRVTQG